MKNKIFDIQNVNCFELLKQIDDNSIDLIATDPPYFGVKKIDWDNQWENEKHYLTWMESVIKELSRVLKKTGSIYLFCNPHLSSKIELLMGKYFQVKNHIVWVKTGGFFKTVSKQKQTKYFPQTERIIFASSLKESTNLEKDKNIAKKHKEIIDYLMNARKKENITNKVISEKTGSLMHRHWFSTSQWSFPKEEDYIKLQEIIPSLDKPYKELKELKDKLQRELELEERYFNVANTEFNTDIWIADAVQYYKDKHPCEKPQQIMEQIIKSSSRVGDVVLDLFLGSGATAIATLKNDRLFIGCDTNEVYFKQTLTRICELY